MEHIAGLLGQYAAFLLSAVVTSLAFYFKKRDENGNRVPFDPVKLIGTVLTAFILATTAFVLFLTGILPAPDVAAVETYLYTFGFAGPFALFVQAVAQGIYRRLVAAS